MTDGVDAGMQGMEAIGLDSSLNGSPSKAKIEELLARDHPVLPLR